MRCNGVVYSGLKKVLETTCQLLGLDSVVL